MTDSSLWENRMIRLKLSYFFELGAALNPLNNLNSDGSVADWWTTLYGAERELDSLFSTPLLAPAIKTSYESGQKLIAAIKAITAPQPDYSRKLTLLEVYNVTSALRDFQTIVKAELAVTDAYFVTRKAGYDTTLLVTNAEQMFPSELGQKTPDAVPEIRAAGKCLAFEMGTAAGFHVFRAMEIVLRHYWTAVTSGKTQPKQKNIGVYLDHLEKGNYGSAKVRAALKQIKDLHRNTLIHPEDVLTPDDAIGLFGIAHSAITAMLKAVPVPTSAPALVAGIASGSTA